MRVVNRAAQGLFDAARGIGFGAGSHPASAGLGGESSSLPGSALNLGGLLGALDWDSAREEVDRESRARIVIAGAPNAGKSTLVNSLKGAPVSPSPRAPEAAGAFQIEDLGLFALVDVPPACAAGEPGWQPDSAGLAERESGESAAWSAFQSADLVLWVLDAEAGMRPWEHEWICRARAAGRPLVVALNKVDQPGAEQALADAQRLLAGPVIGVSALDGESLARCLLPRVVDAAPSLNTALGRESPVWRRAAARRATGRAALLCGLVGLEPVPFLDLPVQALLQARLVLRMAAIHDQPHDDRYSRELLAAMIGGAVLRYAGQQMAKLVPLAGWLLSSALAAAGAWVIGLAAEAYFAHSRRIPLPALPHRAPRRAPRRAPHRAPHQAPRQGPRIRLGMPRALRRLLGRSPGAIGDGG